MTRDQYGAAYELGFSKTVRVLIRQGADPSLAEEVAQGAWAKGWEHLGQLRNEKKVVAWVGTIALNIYRRSCRFTVRGIAYRESTQTMDSELAALDIETLLQYCSTKDRRFLRLVLQGFTVEQIARHKNATKGAVIARLVRARRAMRQALHRVSGTGAANEHVVIGPIQLNITVIFLHGKIVAGDAAKSTKRALKSFIRLFRVLRIGLDLSNVTLIDAAGIGILISIYSLAKSKGTAVQLVRVPPHMQTTLRLTRLDNILTPPSRIATEAKRTIPSTRTA